MRRLLAWLLIFLLPVAALAEPETPYGQGLSVRYALLPASQQTLVDLLYKAALTHETTVAVPEGTKYDDLNAAFCFVSEEYPELIALDNQTTLHYYQNTPDVATAITLQYIMSQKQEEERRSVMMQTAEEIVAEAPTGLFDRELFLHDKLCSIVSYDSDTYGFSTADLALVDGMAVCEGYTRAMTLLCRMAGIPCSFVSGTDKQSGENHAWNLLLLDGTACYTDVTSDDSADGITLHWYFNLSAAELSLTHSMKTAVSLPSDDTWEYHRMMGLLVEEGGNAADVLVSALSKGLTPSLRFVSSADYAVFAEQPLEVLNQARARLGLSAETNLRYSKDDTTQCAVLLVESCIQ
ncbi:MAG: transglutaminase-like domain-containing protein [Clostridia bacterium]|nr:transglutaminase-like domain-containing protein [Clostridia bacterium]